MKLKSKFFVSDLFEYHTHASNKFDTFDGAQTPPFGSTHAHHPERESRDRAGKEGPLRINPESFDKLRIWFGYAHHPELAEGPSEVEGHTPAFRLESRRIDLIIFLGVLHHTNNCLEGIKYICRNLLGRGGHFFVGLHHKYGRQTFESLLEEEKKYSEISKVKLQKKNIFLVPPLFYCKKFETYTFL